MAWQPAENRYEKMKYNRCGRSGLKLPAVSLGLWHNFGDDTPHDRKVDMCRTAFDLGITHFDLANNYGANTDQPGIAEEHTGRVMVEDLKPYRDEIIVSSMSKVYACDPDSGDVLWTAGGSLGTCDVAILLR